MLSELISNTYCIIFSVNTYISRLVSNLTNMNMVRLQIFTHLWEIKKCKNPQKIYNVQKYIKHSKYHSTSVLFLFSYIHKNMNSHKYPRSNHHSRVTLQRK